MMIKAALRQQAKDLVFKAYAAGRGLRGDADRRVAVLCYHRVSDALRDHVTVGVDQFDRQLAFLRTNYQVVGLRQLVEGDQPGGDAPLVAVTFDDGYLDNYQNAFPLLKKHGIGATFFLSTDHITEQKPFDHDLEKLGYGLPNMSWDQIREMHRHGMDFGSHTANHVDLGKTDEVTTWRELTRSDQAVKTELGLEENLFAFPFGRPQNLSADNHALIKNVGYRCCCSANGGLNDRAALDDFDIKRIGINYGFSLPAFQAYIAGWSHNHANAT